jgi:hypothetical protein
MPLAGYEPAIPASEQLQTLALDHGWAWRKFIAEELYSVNYIY